MAEVGGTNGQGEAHIARTDDGDLSHSTGTDVRVRPSLFHEAGHLYSNTGEKSKSG